MLKLEELRIGNKVKCTISNDHGIYTVLAIPGWWIDDICMNEPHVTIDRCPKQTVPISKLRPIKLNLDLLLEYGFAKDELGFFMHHTLKCRWVTEKLLGDKLSKPFLRFDSILKPPKGCVDLYHLHEVQNLYYDMTGEEFTIKMKTAGN